MFNLSVGGGELFDRIIDENYTLMELDAVVFIRQICEGLQHMHKMYILHLDLKVTKQLIFVIIYILYVFENGYKWTKKEFNQLIT